MMSEREQLVMLFQLLGIAYTVFNKDVQVGNGEVVFHFNIDDKFDHLAVGGAEFDITCYARTDDPSGEAASVRMDKPGIILDNVEQLFTYIQDNFFSGKVSICFATVPTGIDPTYILARLQVLYMGEGYDVNNLKVVSRVDPGTTSLVVADNSMLTWMNGSKPTGRGTAWARLTRAMAYRIPIVVLK